jgi:hypothetical protein
MKKNVAGQKIGAEMVNATTGAAFTGTVTVSVTGDAGTQATGSVGSGTCAHEGNGYHTYAPAQAETNYDLVAFTFTGTGAIPVSVQVFTSFPQTGDAYAVVNHATHGLAAIWGYLAHAYHGLHRIYSKLKYGGTSILNLDKANYSISTASETSMAEAFLDAMTTGHAVGSVGEKLERVDVVVSTRLATAGYTAPSNSTIAAIKLETANIAAVKLQTDKMKWVTAAGASGSLEVQQVDVESVNGRRVKGNGTTGNEWLPDV